MGFFDWSDEQNYNLITSQCPKGFRYLRGLFQNCDKGYTLDSTILQNECVCINALNEGKEKIGESVFSGFEDVLNKLIIFVVIAAIAYFVLKRK